eukprot:TRINITY_DN11297_c0_g1_i2.p1 TRINITY_DN11297_c0_g1~~TRINITY_DN11297_c0_g1_i2.p1  ORF type:complete len:428 (+),score=74.55 TRINITY_DN11297_c0_g1_i2:57-1340(+)
MELFHPSSKHGALPPLLFSQKREDVYKALPELARLSEFMDSLVIRKEPGEKEGATSALTMPDGAATKAIEDFNYKPMIEEAAKLAEEYRSKASATAGSHLFIYRAVARHIVAMYLHIDQYRSFHATYDSSRNFLEQNFGLAKNSTPADLETLVLETEKATRGYGPEDDTVQLLKDKKLSFVLAYPDYAAAYLRPDTKPDSVHNLDPVAYLLGGTAEKYFKLLHLAVESKLGPLVESAEAMINGVPSEKRAEIINRAADRAREAACVIIKMPELSDPAVYLHLRWFIQGPYNSPSYPEGITVRGVKIARQSHRSPLCRILFRVCATPSKKIVSARWSRSIARPASKAQSTSWIVCGRALRSAMPPPVQRRGLRVRGFCRPRTSTCLGIQLPTPFTCWRSRSRKCVSRRQIQSVSERKMWQQAAQQAAF